MRRLVVFASLLLIGLFAQPAAAQLTLTWSPRADVNAALPASIQVFEAAERDVYYVRAGLDADEGWTLQALLSDAPGGAETVASFAEDTDALVAINGGYFGGGQTFSLVVNDGQTLANNVAALTRSGTTYYPTRSAFGLLDDGAPDVAWIYAVGGTQYAYPDPSPNRQGSPQPQPSASFPAGGMLWPVETGIGGGPVLVEDGQVRLTWEEEVFFGSGVDLGVRRARTAVGYDASGALLILSASEVGGLTLTEAAEALVGIGAVEAVNLDGGGSSSLVAADQVLVRTSRAVTSALVLAPPPGGGGEDTALFFDTGDACCYRETSGWFESANTPFYGTTPSRLNEVGTGEDRAVFVFDGLTAGTYEVAAWWVPSFNRATNTPYTIYQNGQGTTVRVDQSDAGTLNQWNALGTFTLAPGDSVVVADDATGSASPAFVVADAVRLAPLDNTAVETGQESASPRLFPNPTAGAFTLAFEAPQPGLAEGVVYDLLGRAVHRFEATLGAGPQHVRVEAAHLPVGVYFVRLVTPIGAVQRPLVVAR